MLLWRERFLVKVKVYPVVAVGHSNSNPERTII